MSKIKSYTSLSGMKTVHYDEAGNKIGESWTSASGGQITHYDADGNKTGVSYKSPAGHMTHYDSEWNKTGHSQIIHSGQVKHYDVQYNKTGESNQGFLSMSTTNTSRQATSGHGVSSANIGCATMLFLMAAAVLLICLLL